LIDEDRRNGKLRNIECGVNKNKAVDVGIVNVISRPIRATIVAVEKQ
jgi:hypothetical protein